MQFRNWQKSPSRSRFSEPETCRNSVKLGGRFLDDRRGLVTYLKRPRGTPRAPQVAALAPQVAAPPCAQTLAAPLLPPQSAPAWRSPAEISPPQPPRRRAAGIPRRSTTSAARWNGEKDVVINTERVTECGGAARLWHRQDLLRAFENGK